MEMNLALIPGGEAAHTNKTIYIYIYIKMIIYI